LLNLGQPNSNPNFYYDEWRKEVENPEIFWNENYEIDIEIKLNEKELGSDILDKNRFFVIVEKMHQHIYQSIFKINKVINLKYFFCGGNVV
jgi:hypothetical protein